MANKKVILITGASSGIGEEAARSLAAQGHTVYGAARRKERLEALLPDGVVPLALDVTDEAACTEAVRHIIHEQGHIDVIINNAGYGSYGAIEDVHLEEAHRQFEVNVFGVAAIVKAALPYFRAQHSGTIITTSSMGGRLVSYFGGWYHATKYAIEALSDALRMELASFGINVVLIEPGGIKTDWGHIAADHLAESSQGGAYEKAARKTAEGMHKQYSSNMLSSPKVVVRAISRAFNAHKPKPRYVVGFMAKPLIFLHAVLPTRTFDWMMKKF